MSDQTTLKKVAAGVEEVLNAVAKAHSDWCFKNQTESGILERAVSYCAFEILRNTFRLEGVVDDDGKERLDDLIESVSISLTPLSEAIKTKASA